MKRQADLDVSICPFHNFAHSSLELGLASRVLDHYPPVVQDGYDSIWKNGPGGPWCVVKSQPLRLAISKRFKQRQSNVIMANLDVLRHEIMKSLF
jgi:hypothetical protein